MLSFVTRMWETYKEQGERSTLIAAKGALIALLIQASGAGTKYVLQILLARWLGAVEYGAYTYVLTWAQVLALLAGLGLAFSAIRFVPEYLSGQKLAHIKGLIVQGSGLILAVSVGVAAAGSGLVHSLNISPAAFLPGLWLVPLLALTTFFSEVIRGTQNIGLAYLPSMLLQPLLTIAAAFAFLRLTGNLTSVSTIGVTATVLLLMIGTQAGFIRRILPGDLFRHRAEKETRTWLRVSLPLLFVSASIFFLNQADLLFIGFLRGPEQAGYYAAAVKTAFLVSLILAAVNASVAPLIASMWAEKDVSGLQSLVLTVTRWTLLVSVVVALGLLITGRLILHLFGPGFQVAYIPLLILVSGQVVNAGAGPVGYLLSLTGYHDLAARVYGISALLNIVLHVILIPRFGLLGAALATTTTMVLWNIWLTYLVRKNLGIRSFVSQFGP
jgi:O-antigen/teichoic acid export membrane protein